MVTIIGSGEVIRGALSYNENKVKEGDAVLLAAVKYPKDADKLSFNEKLNLLQRQADMRPSVDHRCVHISVNFDPSDELSNDQLLEIAERYMEGIGFGEQPYLIYSHTDAAHPHLHIVSTPITADGNLISLHNLGKTASSAIRERLETDFNLVRAKGRNSVDREMLKPADLNKAHYGKRQTKAAISNVVRSIFHHFKFTTFAEFNAALNAFNVVADTGSPGMQMHQKGGLIYYLLDPTGSKIGKGIKASSIYDKPTLKKITEKFEKNVRKRDDYKARICRIVDDVLAKGVNETSFLNELDRYDISVILRRNKEGRTYGITYVDRKTLYVFNGSDLGKNSKYSASGIISNLLRENESPKYLDNKRRLNETLANTKFEGGIKSVLVQWMQQGLFINAENVGEGHISYAVGRLNSTRDQHYPLDSRIGKYLYVNDVTPEKTAFIRQESSLLPNDILDTLLQDLHHFSSEQSLAHLTKIVDACFEPTSGGRSVSSALLNEAKRKRKKRRR